MRPPRLVLFLALSTALFGCTPAPTQADPGADDTTPAGDTADPDADDTADPDADDADDADATPSDAPCGTEVVTEQIAIPTFDDHALNGYVVRPVQADCQLPTILIQTPYGAEAALTTVVQGEASRPLFESRAYNVVVVDARGRFGSSAVPRGSEGPILAQDAYDTVEWIAAQPWSDGKVGTWGVSALCRRQYQTAIGPVRSMLYMGIGDEPPPHLVAMVPIFCPLRTEYEAEYPGGVLRHERLAGLDLLGFGVRSLYESHPRQDVVWDVLEAALPTERVQVPALVVMGWYDLMPNTSLAAFEELVAHSDPDVRDAHRLLIGPWFHFAVGGEQTSGAGRAFEPGELDYVDLERRIDRDSLAFFDHHMRGIDNEVGQWAPVRYHHVNAGWREASTWPPPDAQAHTFYLRADGSLSNDAPTDGTLSFDHDPADPSPTIGGGTLSPYSCLTSDMPIACNLGMGSEMLLHGPASQAPLLERSDQQTFQTAVLETPLSLVGRVRVHVDVSTTGADGDIAVRLLDIDPSGDPLLIGEGIHRISARDSFREPAEVVAGTRYSVEVELLSDIAHDVLAGHRLGLMISAANWPMFARNPNDGAVFYRGDTAAATSDELLGDGQPATHTLYLDGATRLEILGGD